MKYLIQTSQAGYIGGLKMETFTRYVLKDGKIEKIKVPKDEALKAIDEILEEDREFLEIMEKL